MSLQFSVESTSNLGRSLKVQIPAARLALEIANKLNKVSKEVSLKGFRPGKAPRKLVQERFGSSIRSEAINDLINSSFTEALESKKLQPVDMPQINVDKVEDASGVEYTATFEVYPEVNLASFSKIEVEQRSADIEEATIEKTILNFKKQYAKWNDVSRAAKADDRVTFKYSTTSAADGKELLANEVTTVNLGSEGILPGLTEALLKKKAGDHVDVTLTYPTTWVKSEFVGQSVKFSIDVEAVKEAELPSDEDIAKRFMGETATVESFKAFVKTRLEDEVKEVVKSEVKEAVLEQMVKLNSLELPVSLVEKEKKAMVTEYFRSIKDAQTEPQIPETLEDDAKQRVLLGLLMNEVIKQNKLVAKQDKIHAEITRIALTYPEPQKVMETYYSKEPLYRSVERLVLLDEAVSVILKEAKISEKKVSFDDIMAAA